MQGSLEQQNII